ncbi:hypothetical protein F511_46484 [Dorcoceras hygrometricum]|nr:hypothetical protein F511_46484 [Dorcoceras hygrometricum]
MPEDSAEELHEQHEAEARPKSSAEVLFEEIPTVVTGEGRCAVCMRGFRTGGTQVRCGHVFHVNCIAQWVSVNSCCPLCRARLSS